MPVKVDTRAWPAVRIEQARTRPSPKWPDAGHGPTLYPGILDDRAHGAVSSHTARSIRQGPDARSLVTIGAFSAPRSGAEDRAATRRYD